MLILSGTGARGRPFRVFVPPDAVFENTRRGTYASTTSLSACFIFSIEEHTAYSLDQRPPARQAAATSESDRVRNHTRQIPTLLANETPIPFVSLISPDLTRHVVAQINNATSNHAISAIERKQCMAALSHPDPHSEPNLSSAEHIPIPTQSLGDRH